MAVWLLRPCFHRAALILALPSGVRGPVLGPPCMRHWPFAIGGDWHRLPLRVLRSAAVAASLIRLERVPTAVGTNAMATILAFAKGEKVRC